MHIITRPQYLELLRKFRDTEFVKVITGVRRAGKTYLLRMFQEELRRSGIADDHILYITFESMRFATITNAHELYQYVMDRVPTSQRVYLFFDEVQRVPGWEQAINSFRVDLDADIYVSGSNSSLLSGELATLLTGRTVSIQVFPLSFKECVNFKDLTAPDDRDFADYVTYGGFPAAVLAQDPEVRQSVLDGIYSSILLKDVGVRGNVRQPELLIRLSNYLMSEIGNQVVPTKLANVLKSEGFRSVSFPSIARYLQLLNDAFLFSTAPRYNLRGKALLRSNSKYYVIDTGLRNTTLVKTWHDNFGHQIENVVYLELLRRGWQVEVGQLGNLEIDFVAHRGGQVHYYQVTRQLPENSEREVANLRKLPDAYPKTVITANRMDVGNIAGIDIVHVVDWLLDRD